MILWLLIQYRRCAFNDVRPHKFCGRIYCLEVFAHLKYKVNGANMILESKVLLNLLSN